MKKSILNFGKTSPVLGLYAILTGALVPIVMSTQLHSSTHPQLAAIGAFMVMLGLALVKLSGGLSVSLKIAKENAIPFIASIALLGLMLAGLARWTSVLIQPVL